MLTRAPRGANSEDTDLCVRAAWLHYGAGLTQGEVAKRLGIPSLKAHRLIARANKEGLVRFSIDGDISECLRLEDAICHALRRQILRSLPGPRRRGAAAADVGHGRQPVSAARARERRRQDHRLRPRPHARRLRVACCRK